MIFKIHLKSASLCPGGIFALSCIFAAFFAAAVVLSLLSGHMFEGYNVRKTVAE